MKRIVTRNLSCNPPDLSNECYVNAKYLIFDGTYFKQQGCLAVLVDARAKRFISYQYISRESYTNLLPIFRNLKSKGLNPVSVTIDGHQTVIRALTETWPNTLIQRCLFHIKNQGLMWIRYLPKTQAAWELKQLLYTITDIKTKKDQIEFTNRFIQWKQKYKSFIQTLDTGTIAHKDLKRTRALISNAIPNMFHFINDKNIPSTTNYLESFYSQLKHHYRSHRGLTEQHKIQYLKWYCYLKNS